MKNVIYLVRIRTVCILKIRHTEFVIYTLGTCHAAQYMEYIINTSNYHVHEVTETDHNQLKFNQSDDCIQMLNRKYI